MTDAFRQFQACAHTLYSTRLEPREFPENLIEKWYTDFKSDLYDSKLGYPQGTVRKKGELEDRIREIVEESNTRIASQLSVPTLCLSHDIDYLKPTVQMKIKNAVGYGAFKKKSENYLQSIKTLLEIDAKAAGKNGVSTVFVATKERAPKFHQQLGQWVLDPAYKLEDPLFLDLLAVLDDFECEIGLHGSFFSLEEGLLSKERIRLEKHLGRKIKVGRQHWLRLPKEKPFETLLSSGIQIDSTLGWNGDFGFRGGFTRPFPIVLDSEKVIWEVPLVLMDGPLFQDLKLKTPQVVEKALQILEEVYQKKGCVALDWHDRAATKEYGWEDAYSQILDWAKKKGFQFSRMSDVIEKVNDTSRIN